nr:hypothetical protein [Paenibacillus massiliensis]
MSVHLIAQACSKRQGIEMGNRRKVSMIWFRQLAATMDKVTNAVFY